MCTSDRLLKIGDDMTHEEAMRQAVADKTRSQSARKASHSPSKASANVGSGLSTASWSKSKHCALNKLDGPLEAMARPSPILTQFPSSDHTALLSDIPAAPHQPTSHSLVPMYAPSSSGSQAKPSPFHISDTPGSWGSAIPMSVAQPARPRLSTPKSLSKLDRTGDVGLRSSREGMIVPTSSAVDQQVSADVPAQARPSKLVRRGPVLRTADLSPLLTPQELPISPSPSQPIDQDELDTEEASYIETGSSLDPQSLPTQNQITIPVGTVPVTVPELDSHVATESGDKTVFDRTSPIPVLPSRRIDDEPDKEVSPQTEVPRPTEPHQGTAAQSPMGQEPNSTMGQTELKKPDKAADGASSTGQSVHTEIKEHTLSGAEGELLLPVSEAKRLGFSGELRETDLPLLDIMPVDQVIEIDDMSDSLPAGMDHIDLSRSRASSSGGSFEEIPAEIARTQVVFSRPSATLDPARTDLSQPVQDSNTPTGVEKQVPRTTLEKPVVDSIAQSEAESGRPSRLRRQDIERAQSTSSSSGGSPSKRQSNRLASRTLTPVYSFSMKSQNPIQWRQTVEMDGESDVEDLLRAPSRSASSGSSSAVIDGIERTLIATYKIPIIDSPPPPERRSRAIRAFDTRLIDDWNKMSPGLTHNPALHRLIFESYIDQCVDGDEPEIKVYNNVDLESIPPHFEFQYSNEMLYNADVPEPELGLGCDCEGGCSETSDTCSCLKRQRLYNYDINEDFAYDEHGHLKQPVPIWECGPNCGCPPECMNRVIQRGRSDKALIDLFKTVSSPDDMRVMD